MKDAKGHGSDARGGMSQDARRNAGDAAHNKRRAFTEKFGATGGTMASRTTGPMPIPGHLYHAKTNDELQFIQKDASAAAKNMQGMGNAQAEGKYLDQVNDASTVLGYRQRGGADLSQGPAAGVAAQHGISGPAVRPVDPVTHNSQGHEWGSPAALADFKAEHGGPRDHAAEQRGFNSGMREINRLKRQGK